jgi:hypothetical protein
LKLGAPRGLNERHNKPRPLRAEAFPVVGLAMSCAHTGRSRRVRPVASIAPSDRATSPSSSRQFLTMPAAERITSVPAWAPCTEQCERPFERVTRFRRCQPGKQPFQAGACRRSPPGATIPCIHPMDFRHQSGEGRTGAAANDEQGHVRPCGIRDRAAANRPALAAADSHWGTPLFRAPPWQYRKRTNE